MAFELHLTVPRDPRYAVMLVAIADHAARQAGRVHGDGAFAQEVERVALGELGKPGALLEVTVRHASGPLQIVIGRQILTLDI